MEENINKLETILFIKGDMVLKEYVYKTLSINKEIFSELLISLKDKYKNHALSILETESEVGFVSTQEMADFIEQIEKKEISGELSKSSLETLAVILYKNGATRSDIDYVRGVNSSFILKNLYIRGLIERKEKEGDLRTFIYSPTADLLRFMGITSISELPDFGELFNTMKQKIDTGESGNE